MGPEVEPRLPAGPDHRDRGRERRRPPASRPPPRPLATAVAVLPLARHHQGVDIVGEIAEVVVTGALGAEALGADPEVARREGRRRLGALPWRRRRRGRRYLRIIIEAGEERVGCQRRGPRRRGQRQRPGPLLLVPVGARGRGHARHPGGRAARGEANSPSSLLRACRAPAVPAWRPCIIGTGRDSWPRPEEGRWPSGGWGYGAPARGAAGGLDGLDGRTDALAVTIEIPRFR